MLVGTGGIFVFEQIVRKALEKAGVRLPSSLVSMVAAFILLKVYIFAVVVLLSLWYIFTAVITLRQLQRN